MSGKLAFCISVGTVTLLFVFFVFFALIGRAEEQPPQLITVQMRSRFWQLSNDANSLELALIKAQRAKDEFVGVMAKICEAAGQQITLNPSNAPKDPGQPDCRSPQVSVYNDKPK